MSALGIAMLILGCSETPAPCVPLFVEKPAFQSVESCEDQSEAYLFSHLDAPWPVLMARCLPYNQLPRIDPAAAKALVEEAGDRAFISNTADRFANERGDGQAPDFLRRLH